MSKRIVLAVLISFTGCHVDTEPEATTPTAPKAVEGTATVETDPQVAATFRQERDEFMNESRARLAKIEARIDAIEADLSARGAELKAETRAELTEARAELKEQRVAIKAQFEASARTTRANWNQFKRDVQEGLDRLEAGAQNAVDRMRAAGIEIQAEIEDAVD